MKAITYAKKLMLRVLTSFCRNCTPAPPVMLSEVGLSEGQSHAVEASLPASPRCRGWDFDSPSIMTAAPKTCPELVEGGKPWGIQSLGKTSPGRGGRKARAGMGIKYGRTRRATGFVILAPSPSLMTGSCKKCKHEAPFFRGN